jgi:hypothetical protein
MDLTAAQIKRIKQKRKDEKLFKDGLIEKRPPTWDALNKEFGCPASSGEALRKWYCDRYVRNRIANYDPPVDEPSENAVYSSIEVDSDKSLSVDFSDLLVLHGYDPKLWEVSSARSSKLSNGKFSSSICVKPKHGDNSIDIESIIDRCLRHSPLQVNVCDRVVSHEPSLNGDSFMLEIAIADLHLGRRSFDGTGSFEIKESYAYAVNEFVRRTAQYNIEEIVFTIGNDFFNFDGISGATTKGTLQSNDMSWTSVFEHGVTMAIDAIEMLKQIARVRVVYVPSNHDRQAGWYMAKVIEAKYDQDEMVSVDAESYPRKYVQYGNNMIAYWHGDGDMKRTLQTIPLEVPEMFASTIYRELHTGHVHHISDNESCGITQRTLPTFTSPDEWHVNQSYIGAIPRTSAYLWNRERGLEQILYVNF